jgi:hypothetical protein
MRANSTESLARRSISRWVARPVWSPESWMPRENGCMSLREWRPECCWRRLVAAAAPAAPWAAAAAAATSASKRPPTRQHANMTVRDMISIRCARQAAVFVYVAAPLRSPCSLVPHSRRANGQGNLHRVAVRQQLRQLRMNIGALPVQFGLLDPATSRSPQSSPAKMMLTLLGRFLFDFGEGVPTRTYVLTSSHKT